MLKYTDYEFQFTKDGLLVIEYRNANNQCMSFEVGRVPANRMRKAMNYIQECVDNYLP